MDIGLALLLKLVSALFYKEMNASRERTMVLYDRILRDDRLDRLAALVSDIHNAQIKSATITKLALQSHRMRNRDRRNSNKAKFYEGA